jgi:hypothetical protein
MILKTLQINFQINLALIYISYIFGVKLDLK